MSYFEPAYAKLNLTLDILGKRDDGFHDLRMVMQSIDLQDTVALELTGDDSLTVTSNLSFLPCGEDNIAAKAALRFFEATGLPRPGLSIHIQKSIPVCAGMAGGSTDGAAVLRLLRRIFAPEMTQEALESIAAQVGSDVPYCVRGGTARAEGRGELLTDLPSLPDCSFVICKPPCSVSTPELFGQVRMKKLRCHPDTAGMEAALMSGDLDGVAQRLYNVFEDVLPRRYGEVFDIKRQLLDLGAMAASMTGSGPTVFGMFRTEEKAREAAEALRDQYPATFFCKTSPKSV